MKGKLPRNNNADSGTKAHNDNRAYKVGRIRHNSWASKVLKSYDIIVYESELVHIRKQHGRELSAMGLGAFEYVRFIVSQFNEVYSGNNGAKILVYRGNSDISQRAIIEIVFDGKQYKIKTATPIKTERLLKMKLLCANSRRVGY